MANQVYWQERELNLKNQTKDEIEKAMHKKPVIAKVLLMLEEEPRYPTELSGKLGTGPDPIRSALLYLNTNKLIERAYTTSKNKFVKDMIKAKHDKIRAWMGALADNTIRMLKFYVITKKGKKFLPCAKKCVLYYAS